MKTKLSIALLLTLSVPAMAEKLEPMMRFTTQAQTDVGAILYLNANKCKPVKNGFVYTAYDNTNRSKESGRGCFTFNKDLKSVHLVPDKSTANAPELDLPLSMFIGMDEPTPALKPKPKSTFPDPDTTYKIKHYAKTIDNNWIVLDDTPCEGAGEGAKTYEIMNPGLYYLRFGCWLFRPGDKYVTGMDAKTHETNYWNPASFKDFHGELK